MLTLCAVNVRAVGPLLLALLGAACAEEVGRPPVARIVATPSYIPKNDNFQTPVDLDGTGSSDEVDDPQGTHPLQYRWSFSPSEYRVQEGDLGAPRMRVLLPGQGPVTVQLTVTDGDDGLATRAQVIVGITLP
ncbi:MAG TPA: hypothetical protein VKN99_01520 [Polyangia bacterium]|nr:hypothetical protein [Polyangia bacterium]